MSASALAASALAASALAASALAENRSDMVVYVKMRDSTTQELIKGRYKFPLDTTEKQVLKTILLQFTQDELPRIEEVTLDPVVPLFWLHTKKTYLFN